MKSKIWTALLSVVVAFGLWLYVITVVSPESQETYYDIPVTYQNDILEERGLMIVSEKPMVTLRLEGNRTDLNSLNQSNISILVNLAGIQGPGTHMLDYDIKYPGSIRENAVTRLSQTPSQVVLKVENKIEKNVDVLLEYVGKVPDGFVPDKQGAFIDNPVITISGPESVVSRVHHAKIHVDLEGKTESVVGNYFYTLCDADNNKVEDVMIEKSVDSVNLEVKIQQVKEIALLLDVVPGGGATEDTCKIEMSTDSIWVSGSESKLSGLDSLVLGTVKLAELKNNTNELKFNIELPEGVTNTSGTSTVTVTVTFPDLGKKTLQIPNTAFQYSGVPAGYEVQWITELLEVEFRGPRDLIRAIAVEDVSVSVNFFGEEPGNVTLIPKLTLTGKYTSLGAISNNSVTAVLKEIAVEPTG